MTTRESVRKFDGVKNVVTRYSLKFEAIKPPRDVYKEKRAAVKAGIAQTWAHMAAHPDPSDTSRVQRIVEFGGNLKELEIRHKATIEDEEEAHDKVLDAVVESFCDDLVIAMGSDMVTRSLQKLSKQQPKQSSPNLPLGDTNKKSSLVSKESARPTHPSAPDMGRPVPTPNVSTPNHIR